MLSTLKKNREYVPLEILQTQYRVPYETLKSKLVIQQQLFVKEITLSKLMINPDVYLWKSRFLLSNRPLQHPGCSKKWAIPYQNCMMWNYCTGRH